MRTKVKCDIKECDYNYKNRCVRGSIVIRADAKKPNPKECLKGFGDGPKFGGLKKRTD